jgi:hypothetical protein
MSVSKKPRSRTAAQRAASRANGRKSTGPKTLGGKRAASLNALKNGARAKAATRPMWQAMAELGEDPARFRSLLRDVLNWRTSIQRIGQMKTTRFKSAERVWAAAMRRAVPLRQSETTPKKWIVYFGQISHQV